MKIAFLGGGKIGRAMIEHVVKNKNGEIVFIYDPFLNEAEIFGIKVVNEITESIFNGLDLVVECAQASVLSDHLAKILPCCSIMPFSMTAFRDDGLREQAKELCERYGTNVFLPHGATELFPRNVNVHAAVALAGIGFDRTRSKITADPSVDTNTHIIHLAGDGIDFEIRVSSFSEGGVSGKYVPLSACGSLDRVLGGSGYQFV